MGINVIAKNGGSRSWSYLYWSWIRHVASEEGVALPQSESSAESLTEDEAKRLALALRIRADKIRNGTAPRDAAAYVRQVDKTLFPPMRDRGDLGDIHADFDDPDSIVETAIFFDSSGGATLTY